MGSRGRGSRLGQEGESDSRVEEMEQGERVRVDWKWVCDGDTSGVVEWDRRKSRCRVASKLSVMSVRRREVVWLRVVDRSMLCRVQYRLLLEILPHLSHHFFHLRA